jgi:hypothetical protein
MLCKYWHVRLLCKHLIIKVPYHIIKEKLMPIVDGALLYVYSYIQYIYLLSIYAFCE